MWPGQHEDWASSPVTLVPGGKKGEQLADAMSTRINLPALLLKDENSLLTSGTGIAIADHVALSGGLHLEEYSYQQGISSRESSKL